MKILQWINPVHLFLVATRSQTYTSCYINCPVSRSSQPIQRRMQNAANLTFNVSYPQPKKNRLHWKDSHNSWSWSWNINFTYPGLSKGIAQNGQMAWNSLEACGIKTSAQYLQWKENFFLKIFNVTLEKKEKIWRFQKYFRQNLSKEKNKKVSKVCFDAYLTVFSDAICPHGLKQ